MKDLSYTIDCRGRLFVFAPMTNDFNYEYRGNKWTAYQGCCVHGLKVSL
jgi:hypothetical protein